MVWFCFMPGNENDTVIKGIIMGITLLLESMTSAASVGLGCGTCCGSGISAALYGYLTTHVRNMKESLRAFLDFFFGKLLAVIALCCLAALLGRSVLDESGLLFGVNIHAVVDGFMLLMGVWLLFGWFKERRGQRSCKACGHCVEKEERQLDEKPSRGLLMGMGFGYGVSPCAPLLLMLGYSATLPVGYAAALGGVFAAASTLSPALLLLLLSGVLAGKMRREIPQFLTWFRLACYILLIVLFAVSLAREVI